MVPGNANIIFYAFLLCLYCTGVLRFSHRRSRYAGSNFFINSFTGVAAACGGFLYDNKVMLTGGILVGAAGTLLTILMCKAMNRSLLNVLIGSFGGGAAGGARD